MGGKERAKNSATTSNFSFARFLRVDDIRHFQVFGEIETYMENMRIPPQNQLRSVTQGCVVGFLVCFGLSFIVILFTST